VKALKWMFMEHAPLIIQPRPDWAKLSWMARMLMNCTSDAYAVNKSRMVRLAEYSRDCLIELRAETGISYDERTQGTLQLFRTEKQVTAAEKDIAVLKADGVPFEVLDADACVAAEPGLAAARDRIAGGLRLPGDETGDCFKFTQSLADMARALGVTFRHGVAIDRLEASMGRITAVHTSEGRVTADAFVVALGSYSPMLVRTSGSSCRSTRSRAIRSPSRSWTRPAPRFRPSWTRRTRSPSPALATASVSAAWPRSPAST
jgi:D-amino-acid dehydrogenase